jgi:hypothetical protein
MTRLNHASFENRVSAFGRWFRKALIYIQGAGGFALLFVSLAPLKGYERFELIRHGVRTQGRVVRLEEKQLTTRSRIGRREHSITTNFPVIQFDFRSKTIEFRDWLDTSENPAVGQVVNLLHDEADPSKAMVNRPYWNWLPWAPALGAAVLLLLTAARGWIRGRSGH